MQTPLTFPVAAQNHASLQSNQLVSLVEDVDFVLGLDVEAHPLNFRIHQSCFHQSPRSSNILNVFDFGGVDFGLLVRVSVGTTFTFATWGRDWSSIVSIAIVATIFRINIAIIVAFTSAIAPIAVLLRGRAKLLDDVVNELLEGGAELWVAAILLLKMSFKNNLRNRCSAITNCFEIL